MMRDVDGRLLWLEAEVELDAGAQGDVIVVTSELAETHLLPFPFAEAITVAASSAGRPGRSCASTSRRDDARLSPTSVTPCTSGGGGRHR